MINFDDVKNASVGKWPSIFENLGIAVGDGKHCPCPACGGNDRFRFDDKTGRGEYFCNQCGAGDGVKLVMKVLGVDFEGAMDSLSKVVGVADTKPYQKEKPVSPDRLREMYVKSMPVTPGDPVDGYLKNRKLPALPEMLRFHPKLWEPETKKEHNAMLAIFSDPEGQAVTFHRTYLSIYGNKLDIKSPKKIMPPVKKMTGGAVRLFPVGDTVGIAEGIETAIACHEIGKLPVWAALSSVLLEGFIPPKNIKNVKIFGDNDKNFAGQKAAYSLGNRLVRDGYNVEVEIPFQVGDFLDVLNEGW